MLYVLIYTAQDAGLDDLDEILRMCSLVLALAGD